MARNTGSLTKVSRRYGVFIGGSAKSFEKRNYPPGVHGARGVRRKKSDYAVALAEKQKLRHQYGVLEKQFRRYFSIALSKRGITGETLLQLLELRLDNVVYRLGFAKTRSGARQFVSHGHILRNGRKIDVSSATLKVGDKITVKDSPASRRLASKNLEQTQGVTVPDWLLLDKDNFTGEVVRIPSREDINPIVNEQLIVELYSR